MKDALPVLMFERRLKRKSRNIKKMMQMIRCKRRREVWPAKTVYISSFKRKKPRFVLSRMLFDDAAKSIKKIRSYSI